MQAATDRHARVQVVLLGVIAAVCLIWLCRAATIVTLPLATAFFVAIAVHPVLRELEGRLPRHRWLALVLTMGFIVALLGSLIWAAAEAIDEAVETAPRYTGQLSQLWERAGEVARNYGLPLPENLLGSSDAQQRLGALAAETVQVAWEIVSGLVLVLFLVVLMLIEAHVWSRNTRRVLEARRAGIALDTIGSIATKVRRYLYVRTTLGLASAAVAAVWLLVLGVDLVLVWVVLIFALNYIPNLGSIIAVIPPSLMALVQHGPVIGALTLGGLTISEQVIGNFIEPRLEGRRLQISPVVVLIGLVFWTWTWGPAGALLAVPMMAALLVAGAQIPGLRPIVTLLGGEEDGQDEAGPIRTARQG